MNIENAGLLRVPDALQGGISSISPGLIPLENNSAAFGEDKAIEIVTVPRLEDPTANQANVGIVLDEEHIFEILSGFYRYVTITEISTRTDLEAMAVRKPDLVFSGVKYFDFDGEELWLNDFLDSHNIAYIASNRDALDRESDKSRAKDIMQMAGIASAHYFTTSPGEHPTEDTMPIVFPLFVKPVTGGDSRGVDANSLVNDFPSFSKKVGEIHRAQHSRALVETYLSGKEYSVGVFEDSANGTLVAMPIEIIVQENKNGDRILDFEVKRNDSEKVIAVTDTVVHGLLSDLAKAAFKALGGKSLGRIDFKMNSDHVPHFIEANLMPGLRKGYFYRGCKLNLNMSYEKMILKIAANGLASA